MAGIEVAGLVLGAIPFALRSYIELATFFKDYHRYGLQGFKLRQKYANQADLFKVSIRRLFADTFDKNVMSAMLSDPTHRTWSDGDVQHRLGIVLNRDLDLCDAVKRNVELIQRTLDKVLSTLKTVGLEETESPPASTQTSSHRSTHYHRLSQACATQFSRTKWAFYKKSQVETLLDEVAAANRDLERFVSAIRENREHARPTQDLPGPIDDVKIIQDGYTGIYNALSVTWAKCGCPAHDVELALQCGIDEGSAESLKQSPRDCGIMFHVGPLSKCCYTHSLELTRILHPKNPLLMEEENNIEHSKTDLCALSNGAPQQALMKKKALPEDQIHQCIDSICSGLQELGWSAQPVRQCHQHISSQISYSSGSHYVHVSSCENHFSGISWTLAEILSDEGTNIRLTRLMTYPYQRLKLAYVLALSLLRLYTSPWLEEQERWTSNDVRFVVNQPPDAEYTAIPHLAACQQKAGAPPRNSSDIQVSKCVGNYQIYALGVLLLELAVGSISASSSSLKQSHGVEFAELSEALRLNTDSEAGRALGPRYGQIVSRCIKFEFGVGERNLKHIALQRAFYQHVVCELEGCLNDLSRVTTVP